VKLQIESTDEVLDVDGVKCRIWRGVSERGVQCFVFVHRLAVHIDEDSEQFDRELLDQLTPGRVIPLNKIL